MRSVSVYWALCLIATFAPKMDSDRNAIEYQGDFPGWPEHLEGVPLQPLPMDAITRRFSEGFPGRIALFACNEKRLVLRWVKRPTRKLHSASDCFRGAGYEVQPSSPGLDGRGREWGRFVATRASGDAVRVSECIWDEGGQSWGDVSAWFWQNALKKNNGPWWAISVVEPHHKGEG